MQTTVNKRFAVIGAGISGLSCANHLQSLGFEVEVFEKSHGLSGRMSTRQGEGWSADHGAQYFTARDPLFKQVLDAWIADGIVGRWNPRIGVFEGGRWRESTSNEPRYVANPGMNMIGKHLARTLTLHLNQTIDQLIPINDQWQLSSKESGLFISIFDFLVLALPAPQAAVITKGLSSEIQAICHSVSMDGCWTVMARFSERPSFPFDAAFVNGEDISWICRNQSKPFRSGKESWTVHASAKWSQENTELTPQEASIQLLACAKQLGLDCSDAEISIHRWRYASGFTNPNLEFVFLPEFKLGLCGDWLNGGRVEGAWLSGRKLAGQIENV
jgi:predicted NAD/FAD-dependent oxidoreductase